MGIDSVVSTSGLSHPRLPLEVREPCLEVWLRVSRLLALTTRGMKLGGRLRLGGGESQQRPRRPGLRREPQRVGSVFGYNFTHQLRDSLIPIQRFPPLHPFFQDLKLGFQVRQHQV